MNTTSPSKDRGRGKIKLSAREGSLEACVSKAVAGGGLLHVGIYPKDDKSRSVVVILNVDTWSKDRSVVIAYGPDLKSVTVDNADTPGGFNKLINTINKLLNNLGISQPIATNGPIAGLLRQVFQKPRRFYDVAGYNCNSTQPPSHGGSGSSRVGGKQRGRQQPSGGSGGGGRGGGHGKSSVKPPAGGSPAPSVNLHRVTCKPCGTCCGGLRSRSFRGDWFEVVKYVAQALGVKSLCEVINRYPGVFCVEGTASAKRHGLNALKEIERLVSREHVYKASYLTKRLLECGSNPVCWRYVQMGIEGWYRLVFFLGGRVPGDPHQYANKLSTSLGFKSIVDWGLYLREVIQGLIDPMFTNKHAGFQDVLKVQCRICGGVLDTTDSVVAFLVKLTRHMKRHGINTAEDARRKAEELRRRIESRRGEVGKRLPMQVEALEKLDLLSYIIRLSREVGLIEGLEGNGFVCSVCGRDLKDEAEVVDHLLHAHPDLSRVIPTVDRFASEIRRFGVRSGIIESVGNGYRCALCGADLKSPADVTEHILTHLGEVAWLIRRVREGGEAKEESESSLSGSNAGKTQVQATASATAVALAAVAQPVAVELLDPHIIVYGDVDDRPLYECGLEYQCYPWFYYEWAVEEYGLPGPLVGRYSRLTPLPKSMHLITNGDILSISALSGVDLGTVNVVVRWFITSFIYEPIYYCRLPDVGGTDSGESIREDGNRLTMTLYARDIAELVISHGVLGINAEDGVDVRTIERVVDALFQVLSTALKPPVIAKYRRRGDQPYLRLKLPNPCPPVETTLAVRIGRKVRIGSLYLFY